MFYNRHDNYDWTEERFAQEDDIAWTTYFDSMSNIDRDSEYYEKISQAFCRRIEARDEYTSRLVSLRRTHSAEANKWWKRIGLMLEEIPTHGVYYLRCNIHSGVYIGQSVNMRDRLRTHIQNLMRGKHWRTGLQGDWYHYGYWSFDIGVLHSFSPAPKLYGELIVVEERAIRHELESGGFIYNIDLMPTGIGFKREWDRLSALNDENKKAFCTWSRDLRCHVPIENTV
jgi:hypothetical protein